MYEYSTVGILFSSLIFAVFASVRYWLYRDRLRIPIKWMYFILTSISVTGGCTWLLTGGVSDISFDIYRMTMAVFMFTLSCFIIKAPISEHAFSYAFILAFNAAVETTAFYVQGNFAPSIYTYPVVSSAIIAAAFVPGVKSLERMINRLSDMGSDRVWGWLDLACFSFLFMNLLVTFPHPSEMGLFYPLGRYLMLLGMVGIYKASVRIMEAMNSVADARTELNLTQRQVAMQQNYYDRMISQMDEMRRLRHDQRHHQAVIEALVKKGDLAALSEYLDTTTMSEDMLPVTGNLSANSILLYYMDKAKVMGVQMEVSVSIGRKTPLSDSDLCVILGNLLENAVESQKYIEPPKRYIRITAKGDSAALTLVVDNSFDGNLKSENGIYLSRKEGDGHGLGLASVKSVCDKYGGIFQIETTKEMFMAGIAIGL